MGLNEVLGINDFKPKNNSLWKALIAEFVGNVLLNFFGCGSCVHQAAGTAVIALAFGFTIFVAVQTLGHVSGGHLNPAVTVAMIVTGNTSILKGLLYIIAQCLGAIVGSGLLRAAVPEEAVKYGLGATTLSDTTPAQGLLIEFLLGFILVLTVFGVVDINKHEAKPLAALAIGIAVAVGHLAFHNATGPSMNPARSLGAGVIADKWDDHWVYWVGPILGGIAAGLLYKYVLAAPTTGPLKIIERYTAVVSDEKELKRLDGSKHDISLP